MSRNQGNVLIVVLVFFMMAIAAIAITATDIELMGRAVTTNENIAKARVGLIYLVAHLKNENSKGVVQNGTIDYQEYSYHYSVLSSQDSDLIEFDVDINNNINSFSIQLILDKVANTVELYEILE